jgi:hypothetical protein
MMQLTWLEAEHSQLMARRIERRKRFALNQCVKVVGGAPVDIGKTGVVAENPEDSPHSQFLKINLDRARFYLPEHLAIVDAEELIESDYTPLDPPLRPSLVEKAPPELERRATLLKRIDRIRKSGFIAPKGSWLEPAPVKKKLKNGDIKTYSYWRVRAADPIFQKGAHYISHLYLGTDADPDYKDWCKRMRRRRLIAQIEREIDRLERQAQRKKREVSP